MAHFRVEGVMTELLKRNLTPNKAAHQMVWVQHMNSPKAQVKEIVLEELIYSWEKGLL